MKAKRCAVFAKSTLEIQKCYQNIAKMLMKILLDMNVSTVLYFNTKIYLKKHVKRVHAANYNHKCDLCEKTFSEQNILKRHIKYIHEKIDKAKCKFCNKLFSRSCNLKQHIKNVHEGANKEVACNFCEKKIHIKTIKKAH